MTAVKMIAVDRLSIGLDFRLDDDTGELAELAVSVGDCGVLQPLLVRPDGAAWEVVAGRRRLAAARIVGLEQVPCIVQDLTDDQAADAALDALQAAVHRGEMSPRTTLERAGRRSIRGGGASTHGRLDGETAEMVSHWRRRHDRLLAGIATVIKAQEDAQELKQMLRRLLAIDRKPLDSQEEAA